MALYMYQASYTAKSMAAQLTEPQDPMEAIRPALEDVGAKVLVAGFPFGEYDVLIVYEAADDVTAASVAMAVAAAGEVKSAKTTRVLSGQEWLDSLRKRRIVTRKVRQPPPQLDHPRGSPCVSPPARWQAGVCGAVRVGPGARVLFGAVLTAADGRISVGARSILMENAVIRGRTRHSTVIGDDVLVGPHAHVNGARVEAGCFLATGVALFPGRVAGAGSEVRIRGVVHVNTVLPPGTTVPIGS